MIIQFNDHLKQKARRLRNNSTAGEINLWNHLKSRQLMGLRFLRQKPIENYIVDFYCHKLKLVIEIDGGSHDWKSEYDLDRQNKLEELGYTVFRYSEYKAKYRVEDILSSLIIFIENNYSNSP